MVRELLQRLRYRVDEIFAREFAGQLLLFAVLVGSLTLFGATAVFFGLFAPENNQVQGIPIEGDRDVLQALWWSLLRVLNLPGFASMQGATIPIMAYAFILSLASLAVFAVLISVIRSAIARRLEALSRGDTRVKERGHILVLGWSSKLIPVLQQLAELAPGTTVVILSEDSVRAMQDRLRLAEFNRQRLKIVLRTGPGSEPRELLRVAIDATASVILLSPDDDFRGRVGDSEVIKTMTLIAQRDTWTREPPSVVSEISHVRNHELAQIASREKLFLVKSSRVIGKLIVQSVCNPGLGEVYRQLFDAGGQQLLVSFNPRYQGKTAAELHARLNGAVFLGMVQADLRDGWKHYHAALNPEDHRVVATGEGIVFLALEPEPFLKPATALPASSSSEPRPACVESPGSVLIIGWNNEIHDVLRELHEHLSAPAGVTLLSRLSTEEAQSRIQKTAPDPLTGLDLSCIEGEGDERSTYDHIEFAGFDCIIVLADHLSEERDVDAHTLRVLLRLSELCDLNARHTVVQLEDGSKRNLMQGFDVDEIIVSQEAVSAQLAQVAVHRSLGGVYPALLSAAGVEITKLPVSHYLEPGRPTRQSFAALSSAVRAQSHTALGVVFSSGEVLLNPPRNSEWSLSEHDQVIVLRQQRRSG